jgi:predicted N-acetyltransferase YhbS
VPLLSARHWPDIKGMPFQIEYLADHVDAIPGLARAHYTEWATVTPHLTIPDRAARFQARARRGSIPTGFVAILSGSVVGLACLVECDLDSHPHLSPWLASVLVNPEHRRHGIGSALTDRATEEAKVLGFPRAYLFTFDKQAFYQRLGWSMLEDATFQEHLVTIMVRELAG